MRVALALRKVLSVTHTEPGPGQTYLRTVVEYLSLVRETLSDLSSSIRKTSRRSCC